MPINTQDYINKIEPGLKSDKSHYKFYYRFKIDGKSKRALIDYTNKNWDKKTRISNAKAEFIKAKSKEVDASINFTENSSLNNVADIYFNLSCEQTKWTEELKKSYKLYCRDDLGKKKIKDIRKVHIDNLKKSMETKGFSKQTKNGCSVRLIKKVLVQTIKPILQYAMENKVLEDIPTIKVAAEKRSKKKVSNGGIKLAFLYQTIFSLYEKNGFYRALFLFALYGRRWNEIRTLDWIDIDYMNGTYTIRAENNKINEDQTYELPEPIRVALLEVKDNNSGLVFKSPITGRELSSPKRQLAKIKEFLEDKDNKLVPILDLTMHYFRHILVSAMGEVGTATTILSASLGHTNLKTVNQFYLSANHQKSSQEANIVIDSITTKS